MPPTPLSIDPPLDRALDAQRYLEAHGLYTTVPHIHSSDLSLSADPFKYYLTRRLNLAHFLSWSAALSHGSWFHARAEHYDRDASEVHRLMSTALTARLDELRGLCTSRQVPSDKMHDLLLREERAAHAAWAYFEAVTSLRSHPSPSLACGILPYLDRPNFQTLATEVSLSYTDHANFPKCPLVCRIDRLVYNHKTNRIWILDWKTCTSSTHDRLQTCTIENQTRHYLYILYYLIQEGVIQDRYHLPSSAKCGGMMHIAIQKPTIKFGQRDRPYHYISEGKRSGISGEIHFRNNRWEVTFSLIGVRKPPKSKNLFHTNESLATEYLHSYTNKKPTKVFHGEPSRHLFLKRCLEWYKGEGDYLDEAPLREAQPTFNVSITPITELDEDAEGEYLDNTARVYSLATAKPFPMNFPRVGSGMTSHHSSLSPYAPFYVCPVRDWPEIILREGFIQRSREEEDAATDKEDSPQ